MTDVLIVSLGSTGGLRLADEQLCESLRRAGAETRIASARPQRELRTLMATDMAWALAARSAAREEMRRKPARAVIYSSTTAALLWPQPGAIRFDALAGANRPGRHGLWQRPLERRRLSSAPLLLPYSEGALHEGSDGALAHERTIVLPVAVEVEDPPAPERDIAAITYAANPLKKGLDRVLEAWSRARRPDEDLLVTGVSSQTLGRVGLDVPGDGVRVSGMLGAAEYRALLRRARVFVCAPRREDYGQAQLEALAHGCQLVSTESAGAYAALELARQIDRRLVGEDLARALRIALDEPLVDYSTRALALLEPFSIKALDSIVERQLLPALFARA
ncbi:MAG TPA: glycosyltransferase [Solirubrobacteraceae bacterium]|jgi:glycosyltransferase involved in cell wall biosynthesis